LTSRHISNTIRFVGTKKVESDRVDQRIEEWAPRLPPIDLDIEAAVQRIQWIGRLIDKQMMETLGEFELSHGEWHVLRHLAMEGPPYRSSPGRLSKWEGLSSGAMTNRLDQLEKAGLVRRLPDPEDRRALKVELTDKGHKLWTDSLTVQAGKEAALAAALDERELEQLNKLLRKVLTGLEEKA
jgi:DNA-binding MarR family transcriptional regulator